MTAKAETIKEQAYEEIKLVLNEWRITNVTTNKTLEQFLDEKIESNEIDSYEMLDDGNIEIYRNGYMVEVDEKGNIVSEVQKSGPRPTVTDISIKLQDGTEAEDYSQEMGTPLVIDFKASIEGGEIISIEPNKPYTTNGNEQTITFTITGKINEDKYTRKVKISVSNKYLKTYETMERVANELTDDGYKKVPISANGEYISHGINAIVYNNDLILDGITNVKGATLNDNVYEFGDSTKDVATETEDAQNTVMLKVNGNITINEGVTLTTCKSEDGYGGPKGLIIYCTGKITNNGEISMTGRGAKVTGENVYLYKNSDGTFEFIPAIGAIGGKGVKADSREIGLFKSLKGNKGEDGRNRATGGGGSGAAYCHGNLHFDVAISGAGSAGTSYSGGSGGGACSSVWTHVDPYYSLDLEAGFSGGKAYGSYNHGYPCGGGAGNPSGVGYPEEKSGMNGTGGLLIIYCEEIYNNEKITSNGSQGGAGGNVDYAVDVDGGCSGGGSINIFAKTTIEDNGLIQADGGSNNGGGVGGKGTINIGYINNNQYRSIIKDIYNK